MNKYKIITIAIITLFLSVGVALACEKSASDSALLTDEITVSPCEELSVDVAPNSPCEGTETPMASDSATPTVEPTQAVVFTGNGDGRSDGLSSCPECTKAPVIPNGAPVAGRGK